MPELVLALLAAWVWYSRHLAHIPAKRRAYYVLGIAAIACVTVVLR